MKYNTKFFVTDKPRFITMHDVLCTEEDLGSSTAHDPVAFSEVAFEFADSLRKPNPAQRTMNDCKELITSN